MHSNGEAENFYRDLKARGISVRVGMETTGYSRWFGRLLAELGFEVWIGDAAEIKTRRAKKKKTDREDARLLLKLLLEDRFPRIWVPSLQNRDLVVASPSSMQCYDFDNRSGNERTAGMKRLFSCQIAWDFFVCPLTRTDRFVWAYQHSVKKRVTWRARN
jgi:hypothetical protein